MLHSWGCVTLSDLESLICETKDRIKDFTSRGSLKKVEEDQRDLAQLLQIQGEIEIALMQRDSEGTNTGNTDSSGTLDTLDDWQNVLPSSSFDENASISVRGGRSQLLIIETSSRDLNGSCPLEVALPPPSPPPPAILEIGRAHV